MLRTRILRLEDAATTPRGAITLMTDDALLRRGLYLRGPADFDYRSAIALAGGDDLADLPDDIRERIVTERQKQALEDTGWLVMVVAFSGQAIAAGPDMPPEAHQRP